MDTRYKNFKWTELTELADQSFIEMDFSGADFDRAFFVNSTFEDCVFEKGKPGNLKFFGSHFRRCTFTSFDFRNTPLGVKGSTFTDCKFVSCDFRRHMFAQAHFDGCVFDRCKIKGVNFNDASFRNCKFIGKIEDATFNGMYHEKPTGFPPLDHVDFSEAQLGDFVSFDDCDLSTCTPPAGKTFDQLLYRIYKNNPKVLSTGSPDRIILEQ